MFSNLKFYNVSPKNLPDFNIEVNDVFLTQEFLSLTDKFTAVLLIVVLPNEQGYLCFEKKYDLQGRLHLAPFPDEGWHTFGFFSIENHHNFYCNLIGAIFLETGASSLEIQFSKMNTFNLHQMDMINLLHSKGFIASFNLLNPCHELIYPSRVMVDEFRKKTRASLFRSISHLCNLLGSSSINKHKNRLSNIGHKVTKCSDSDWSHAVNDIISSHIKRWASLGIKSQLIQYNHQAFLRRLSGSQIAECWTLTCNNGDFASGAIVFTWKSRIYYGLSAYNLDYEKYSPGTVLLSYLIEEGFNRGFKIFEYGPGTESYKKMWSNHSVTRVGLRVYLPSNAS